MAGSSCSSSGNQAWHPGSAGQQQQEQQAPLPASQSLLDLESFAASILLDDLQIDVNDSSAHGAPPAQGDSSSGGDQHMQPAAQDSEDSAWAGEPGFGPELSALAAGDFSLQSPFAERPGEALPADALARSSSLAMMDDDLGDPLMHRAASVPPTQHAPQPFFNPAAMESPSARLPDPTTPSLHVVPCMQMG